MNDRTSTPTFFNATSSNFQFPHRLGNESVSALTKHSSERPCRCFTQIFMLMALASTGVKRLISKRKNVRDAGCFKWAKATYLRPTLLYKLTTFSKQPHTKQSAYHSLSHYTNVQIPLSRRPSRSLCRLRHRPPCPWTTRYRWKGQRSSRLV